MVLFEALPMLPLAQLMNAIECARRVVEEAGQRLQTRAEETQQGGQNDPAQQFQQLLQQLTDGG